MIGDAEGKDAEDVVVKVFVAIGGGAVAGNTPVSKQFTIFVSGSTNVVKVSVPVPTKSIFAKTCSN